MGLSASLVNNRLTLPPGTRFSLIDMKIGELAQRSGVTTKAVRYYESLGLVTPTRLGNGYRDYDHDDVRLVREVRTLAGLGIRAEDARPFLECLIAGHGHGDDCPDSVGAYRDAIAEVDARLADLTQRRAALAALLADATARSTPLCQFSNR